MKYYLVFDIGGTTSRSGLFIPSNNSLFHSNKIKTPVIKENATKTEYKEWFNKLFNDLTKDFDKDKEVEQVIIGFPGPISDGIVYRTPTMLGANFEKSIDLKIFQSIWQDKQVSVINDVTAFGYFYVEKGHYDFCVITVGSGIGCKVFLSGKHVVGINGRGGEIGHLKVNHNDDASTCNCGETGHLGSISSGRGILNFIIKESKLDESNFNKSLLAVLSKEVGISNELLVEAFLKNDKWVEEKVKIASSYLANTMASIHTSVGLEKFIINGGFAVSMGEKYRSLLVSEVKKHCWDLGQDWNQMIILDVEPNITGLIGAGIYGKNN